jgi:hypothetical protein
MSWINNWLKPTTPDTTPPTIDSDPDRTPWMRVWLTLRQVNLKELWPVVVSVPAIVFFAVSGMIAWLYLILRGIVRFIAGVFGFWSK